MLNVLDFVKDSFSVSTGYGASSVKELSNISTPSFCPILSNAIGTESYRKIVYKFLRVLPGPILVGSTWSMLVAGFLFLCLMYIKKYQVLRTSSGVSCPWVVCELSVSCHATWWCSIWPKLCTSIWVGLAILRLWCWGAEAACNADAMLTMPEAGWGTSVWSRFLVRGVWGHGPQKNWDLGSICSFVVKMNLEHSNCTWPVQWIVPALEQAPKAVERVWVKIASRFS